MILDQSNISCSLSLKEKALQFAEHEFIKYYDLIARQTDIEEVKLTTYKSEENRHVWPRIFAEEKLISVAESFGLSCSFSEIGSMKFLHLTHAGAHTQERTHTHTSAPMPIDQPEKPKKKKASSLGL